MVTINLRIFTLLAAIFSANYSFAGTVDTAQRMLNQLGYNAGPVDGAYGGKTRAALESFYTDNGGSFDGKLDANEVADLQAAMAERGIEIYRPLNSYDVQRKWTQNPERMDLLVPEVRKSRAVGQGVFWYGPRVKYADFNGDGIDDIVTVGVSAKAFTNPDYRPGSGRCMQRNPDKWGQPKGCNGEDFKMKPRIAWGEPDGGYAMSNDKMFIHPPQKGNMIPGFSHPNGVLVADYNGDNIPDIFVHDSTFGWDGGYQSLYLSNNDGTWKYSTFSHVKNPGTDFGHGGATGDIDGDGDIDIMVTKVGKGIACYMNNGDGTFKYRSKCYSGMIVYTISLADVDGDGDLDAYAGSNSYHGVGGIGEYGGGFRILENDGRGNFRNKVNLPQVDCWVTNAASEPVDIDGDEDIDFITSLQGENYLFNAINIIENQGNWKFEQKTVQVADWDDFNPIYKEMYALGKGSDKCGMYVRNNSTGELKKFAQEGHALNSFVEQLAFADADGDGDKDIIMLLPTYLDGFNENYDQVQGGWIDNFGDGRYFHRPYVHPKGRGRVERLRY